MDSERIKCGYGEEQAVGSPVGNARSILESTGLPLTPLGQKTIEADSQGCI